MKLQTRLFVLIILAMLPMVALEVYDEFEARSERAEEGKDQALRLVRFAAQEQAKVIEGAHQLLTAIGKVPVVRRGDGPACSAFLDDLATAYKQYVSLMSIDSAGRAVCVGGEGEPGSYLENRPYFRLAMANHDFATGEYDPGSASRQRILYLAQPYTDADGRVAGVVAVGLSVDWLNGEIARIPLPPLTTVSMVDRKGTIVARYPEKDRFVGTKIPGQSHAYMLAGDEGAQETLGFDGVARIYAYTPLPGGTPGLTVSIGLDSDAGPRGAATHHRDMMVIAGSSILALALAGIGARLFISRPIRVLLDTADHWRQGNLDSRVPFPENHSEFGRLGAAFNAMAAAVGNREQELERRVQERTDALKQAMEAQRVAEAALHEARKMETVGRLTGGVAHDFNNILAAIVGNIELACARLGPATTKLPWLEAAMQSANRGAALVQQLLTFARRQNLHPQAVDLNRYITDSLDMLQRLLRSDVRVEAKLAPDAWMVRVDPNQLEAAILNLAINARHAMSSGGTLRLETANISLANEQDATHPGIKQPGVKHRGAKHPGANHRGANHRGGELVGDFVALTVADTGTGIPPGILEKVFEPFFTTKEIGAGSGLGLSMVKGFAQQAAGSIHIASEVGRGTTVTLYLPRTLEAAAICRADDAEASKGSGTILLVDDDPAVRSVTSQLLEMSGYVVIAADSTSEALICFTQACGTVDLLITDLVLENGPNGIELASDIRSRCPALPVLLVTGYSEGMLADPRLDGIDVLSKPFGHPVLLQAITRAMRSARRRAAGTAPCVTST